jgi:uncharacterized protein (TIGR02996 family)
MKPRYLIGYNNSKRWIFVDCPWAEQHRYDPTALNFQSYERSGYCLVCGPLHESLSRWLANEQFREYWDLIRLEPNDAARYGVFADWLDEQDAPELADAFRRMWQAETAMWQLKEPSK